MKTKLLSLFAASMLFIVARADPVVIGQETLQQPDQPVSETASVDLSPKHGGGECSVICPLPHSVTANSD